MSQDNPYAAPQSMGGDGPRLPSEDSSGGVWRCGRLLVMRRDAQLPPFCIKTNEPATRREKVSVRWRPPLVSVAMVLGFLSCVGVAARFPQQPRPPLLIFLMGIVASLSHRRAAVQVGLCEAVFRRRRRAMLGAWAVGLGGLGLVALAIVMNNYNWPGNGLMGVLIAVAILTMLAGCAWAIAGIDLIAAKRIEKNHLWLKGAAAEYLERFPEAPAELAR